MTPDRVEPLHRRSATPRPSELAITVAAYGTGREWNSADEIRGRLKLLGFDCTAQQVAAWAGRMCRVDAPWLEKREPWGGYSEYRVTRYGLTDIANRLEGLRPSRRQEPLCSR